MSFLSSIAVLAGVAYLIHRLERKLHMDQTELLSELTAIKEIVTKVKAETTGLLASVDTLQTQLDEAVRQGGVQPEVAALVRDIRASLGTVDALVPDAAPAPAPAPAPAEPPPAG